MELKLSQVENNIKKCNCKDKGKHRFPHFHAMFCKYRMWYLAEQKKVKNGS